MFIIFKQRMNGAPEFPIFSPINFAVKLVKRKARELVTGTARDRSKKEIHIF